MEPRPCEPREEERPSEPWQCHQQEAHRGLIAAAAQKAMENTFTKDASVMARRGRPRPRMRPSGPLEQRRQET